MSEPYDIEQPDAPETDTPAPETEPFVFSAAEAGALEAARARHAAGHLTEHPELYARLRFTRWRVQQGRLRE